MPSSKCVLLVFGREETQGINKRGKERRREGAGKRLSVTSLLLMTFKDPFWIT